MRNILHGLSLMVWRPRQIIRGSARGVLCAEAKLATANTMQHVWAKGSQTLGAQRACNTCTTMLCPGGGLHHGARIEFQRGRAQQRVGVPASNKRNIRGSLRSHKITKAPRCHTFANVRARARMCQNLVRVPTHSHMKIYAGRAKGSLPKSLVSKARGKCHTQRT